MPCGVAGDLLGRRGVQSEVAGQFGHPGQAGGGVQHLPGRIHHDDRPDGDPVVQHGRCSADPALEHTGPRPDPGSHTAHSEVSPGDLSRRIPEPRIGSIGPRADRQVEDHRGRHDRDGPAGHLHTAAAFLQPGHHTVGGGKTEGAASAQDDGIDVPDAVGRVQQFGLATARRPAADIHRANRSRWRHHNRCATSPSAARHVGRSDRRIGIAPMVVADLDTGHVGDRSAESDGRTPPRAWGPASSSGCHRIGLPISPRTRYSCSTVSHWYTSK